MKIAIVFYSMYGHNFAMAKAAAEGAREIKDAEVQLLRVPETLPAQVLEKMGALEPAKAWADVPLVTPDALAEADGVIFATPTRFGNMCAQMKAFMDSLGGLWMKGALVGKPAGVMTSSNTQHGGQESTILATQVVLLHLGMIVCGLPYAFQGQMLDTEITGCSPYGASTIGGHDGSRTPSANELDGARWQGRYVSRTAAKLAK